MRIQYASDLHIEFSDNNEFLRIKPLKPQAKILILAGDIVLFHGLSKHLDFFRYCADNFEQTYWIPGNHEYYHSDLSERSGSFTEAIFPNVMLLNNSKIILDDTTFIFSTLWSYIRPENAINVRSQLNDFHLITNNESRLTVDLFNQMHKDIKDYILQELQNVSTEKTVVVSHHVPTFSHYPQKYIASIINDAFTVELSDIIERFQPDAWIYGHSHFNTKDFSLGKTQVLTNQLGYVSHNEHKEFKNSKCCII